MLLTPDAGHLQPDMPSRLPTPAEAVRQTPGNAKVPGLTFSNGARGIELWAAPPRGDRPGAVYALAPGYDFPLWQYQLDAGHTWTESSMNRLLVDLGKTLVEPDPDLERSAWELRPGWVDADASWGRDHGPQIGPKAPAATGAEWRPLVDGTLSTSSSDENELLIEMTPSGTRLGRPLVQIRVSKTVLEELPTDISIPRLLYDIARTLDPALESGLKSTPHPNSFAGRRQRRVLQGLPK